MSENERVHFKIALPVDLKKQLEHRAVESRRSLSAEIIARLEASLDQPLIPAGEITAQQIAEKAAQVALSDLFSLVAHLPSNVTLKDVLEIRAREIAESHAGKKNAAPKDGAE